MVINPYLDPRRVRAALNAIGVRPSKGMGQNFLINQRPIDQAIEAAELGPEDTVIEVGPGLGVLTWELVRHAGHVISVELDQRLAERLRAEFAGAPNFTLIEEDILRVSPGDVLARAGQAPDTPYKVVANLPYAITSPVLRYFLEAEHPPVLMALMVQWEVALRVTARPPDMSILAHAVQLYALPELVSRVPAADFIPPPQVDSAIVLLRGRRRMPVDVPSTELLFKVIKAGFSQARKKLANALPSGLRSVGMPVDKERVLEIMRAAGVDANRRAETLDLTEWAAITRELAEQTLQSRAAPGGNS